MSCFDQVKWQPISQLPLIGSMIDGALNDSRDHLHTLTKARGRPHGRSSGTRPSRAARVRRYLRRATAPLAGECPSTAQQRELDRLEAQNSSLRQATRAVLDLAAELRMGTIDRVTELSDLELGLRALLGGRPPRG